MDGPSCGVSYKRARFSTLLPEDRRYTSAHFWLLEFEPGCWRIGFTKFATRMLGELVEYEFEVKPGSAVKTGQIIGWVEGFKAVTDLFSVAAGEFLRSNPQLANDIRIIDLDPYADGWLYEVKGECDPAAMDVHAYTQALDRTIDQAQGKTI